MNKSFSFVFALSTIIMMSCSKNPTAPTPPQTGTGTFSRVEIYSIGGVQIMPFAPSTPSSPNNLSWLKGFSTLPEPGSPNGMVDLKVGIRSGGPGKFQAYIFDEKETFTACYNIDPRMVCIGSMASKIDVEMPIEVIATVTKERLADRRGIYFLIRYVGSGDPVVLDNNSGAGFTISSPR